MCIEILVKRDGEEITCATVGELAEALRLQSIQVSPDPEKNCLCNARLDELGARPTTEEEGFPWPAYIIDPGRDDDTRVR